MLSGAAMAATEGNDTVAANAVSDSSQTVIRHADTSATTVITASTGDVFEGATKNSSVATTADGAAAEAAPLHDSQNVASTGLIQADAAIVPTVAAIVTAAVTDARPNLTKALIAMPAANQPVAHQHTQLASVSGTWMFVAAAVVLPAADNVTEAIIEMAAALPPVSVPVLPKGLLAQLTGQFGGVIVPPLTGLSIGTITVAACMAAALVLMLIMASLTVSNYGQWLRRVGYVNAARSGLVSFHAIFATPPLIDFASVPPPNRSLFFEVGETNKRISNGS